jgi:hypothetical protein
MPMYLCVNENGLDTICYFYLRFHIVPLCWDVHSSQSVIYAPRILQLFHAIFTFYKKVILTNVAFFFKHHFSTLKKVVLMLFVISDCRKLETGSQCCYSYKVL